MHLTKLLTLFLVSLPAMAPADPSLERVEDNIVSSIEQLDKISHLPTLLPVIIKNKDFIGLTDEQAAELYRWRDQSATPMLAAMKKIARKRIAIKEAAISPTVSSARLQQMQNEIFRLQREVLQYKLSCRDHIMQTFNDENWASLFMLLADGDTGVSIPLNYAER
ncbi:MAG: hypothetical protein HKP12_02575 [Gammaproteobacteria bacterium]|nr:hypothetical protein [Gammaproteobacteria bacterium]